MHVFGLLVATGLWLVAGTFIGGHLGDVLFYRPDALAADPWLLFHLWDGLSSIGGFAAWVPLGRG